MAIKKENISRELLTKLSRISAHGLVLVIVTYLGLYLGIYLDRIFNMAPNFTIVLLVLGVILGFRGFIQEVITERKDK